jgi:hypothetical protein
MSVLPPPVFNLDDDVLFVPDFVPAPERFRLRVPYVFNAAAQRESFENPKRVRFFRPLPGRDLEARKFAGHCADAASSWLVLEPGYSNRHGTASHRSFA